MTPERAYAYAGVFLAAISLGALAGAWFDRWQRTRRLATAELAFWESLARLVDKAREDIETRPVSHIASVKRMRQQMTDNEVRQFRAGVDNYDWGK